MVIRARAMMSCILLSSFATAVVAAETPATVTSAGFSEEVTGIVHWEVAFISIEDPQESSVAAWITLLEEPAIYGDTFAAWGVGTDAAMTARPPRKKGR